MAQLSSRKEAWADTNCIWQQQLHASLEIKATDVWAMTVLPFYVTTQSQLEDNPQQSSHGLQDPFSSKGNKVTGAGESSVSKVFVEQA